MKKNQAVTDSANISGASINEVKIMPVLMFKNQYNSKPTEGEHNYQVSLTSPNQTMSIDEIRVRFAKGLPLGGNMKVPQYVGEGNDVEVDDDVLKGINWNTLDITEKHAIIKDAMTDLRKLNDGIEYRKKVDRKAKLDQELEFKNRVNTLFEERKSTEQK